MPTLPWNGSCFPPRLMCAISIALAFYMVQTPAFIQRPEMVNGRVATLNKHGYGDFNSNEIVDDFVEWGKTEARHINICPEAPRQPYVLEVAGGYGQVTRRIIEGGGFCLFNDMHEDHVELAKLDFPDHVFNSQWETFVGRFPWDKELMHELKLKRIRGIGVFNAIHFLTGKELEQFFEACYDLLEPGGRLFLTAGTPYNRLFRGYAPRYHRRKASFLGKPEGKPYPGEMPDAWQYLSPEHYPPFFHALDTQMVEYAATRHPEKKFRVEKRRNIERPNPRSQAYRRGYSRGHTELIGMTLEKPLSDAKSTLATAED